MKALHPAREEFAKNALALGLGYERPGAPALFDAAVTNGLVAIVAYEWPGEEAKPDGRMLPASALLDLIERKTSVSGAGVAKLTSGGRSVTINIGELRRAVRQLAPLRHGRGGSTFVHPDAVTALRDLDDHPALSALSIYEEDDREARDFAHDADARAFAESYLAMLSDEEIARRMVHLVDALPFDPKERAAGFDPQECDVCEQEALVVSHIDPHGVGVGIGVCFVCGYQRDEAAATRLARHSLYVDDEIRNGQWG